MAKAKRIGFFSDFHCGHRGGLCPGEFCDEGQNKALRAELYREYQRMIKTHGPFSAIVLPGDLVDGKGAKSGGTELLTADRGEQASWAARLIRDIGCSRIYIARGTPYHTGVDEDWEDEVVKELPGAVIQDRLWLDVNGLMFDVRHFISNSTIPHGKATPLSKEWLWNLVWADVKDRPKADVVIRGHIHSFNYCGGSRYLAMSLPALQAASTKYGRRISCTVDWGIVWFDVESKEKWAWDKDIVVLEGEKVEVSRV